MLAGVAEDCRAHEHGAVLLPWLVNTSLFGDMKRSTTAIPQKTCHCDLDKLSHTGRFGQEGVISTVINATCCLLHLSPNPVDTGKELDIMTHLLPLFPGRSHGKRSPTAF